MRTYTQKGKEHVTQPNITHEKKYRSHFQLIDVIEDTTCIVNSTLNRKTTFRAFQNGEP